MRNKGIKIAGGAFILGIALVVWGFFALQGQASLPFLRATPESQVVLLFQAIAREDVPTVLKMTSPKAPPNFRDPEVVQFSVFTFKQNDILIVKAQPIGAAKILDRRWVVPTVITMVRANETKDALAIVYLDENYLLLAIE